MSRALVFVAGKDILQVPEGGHTSYVRAHLLAAEQAGFEPHVFVASDRSETFESPLGVFHRVRAPGVVYAGRRHRSTPLDAPFVAGALRSFLRGTSGPLTVHSFVQWGSAAAGPARERRERGLRTRLLVTSWDTVSNEAAAIRRGTTRAYSPRERFVRTLDWLWSETAMSLHEWRALYVADLVLVNYESVRQLLRKRYPGLHTAIRRVPYTTDLALTAGAPHRAEPPPGDVKHIVATSRQDARKGVEILLRALALVARQRSDFTATLCGPGPLLGAHRRLRDALGLRGVVRLPGFVPSPADQLAAADLFVLPSLREGSGSMSVLEAMLFGVPIVASGVDGINEDLECGVSGLLVPPGDPVALAAAIVRVLADPALRERLGEAARARFEARFGVDAFVRAMSEVWER